LGSTVRDNAFQEAVEFSDVIEKESGCSFCCDCCVRWNEVYSFGDGVHDSHDGVMSGGLQKFDHKINAERIPLCVQNREWLKLANRRVSPRFCPEAEIAGTYILANVSRHLRPPVVLGHQF